MDETRLYEVAIKTPLRRLFTYESSESLEPGTRVMVPFRNREKFGIVWSEATESPEGLKSIHRKVGEAPLFDEKSLRFYRQAADYYGLSLGDLLHSSIPTKIKDGADIPECSEKHFVPELPKLSESQNACVRSILSKTGFSNSLIHGETGSGKTEVYLHLMEETILAGGQILFLVPEISLTPQLEDRLAERLGARVSVFHSNIKESLRLEAFSRAWHGKTDVFLGARSALFLPYKDLRLIIIDEEHDTSYKQAERATYNARDLAILRAKILDIPVVMGSATPSMESYVRAKSDQSTLYRLPKFYETPQPQIEIIGLKKTWKEEQKSFISEALHAAVKDCLEKKEQCLLFLNRRGSATQRICLNCGHQEACPHCSSTLTLHFDIQRGLCHLCGYQKPIKSQCSECESKDFFVGGIGTKEIEKQIQERFPEARVARLDRDQTSKRNALADTLRQFADSKIDILVGTQMISKGIDIPKLSLVGIILADQGWGVPDFRAMERSFQLLQQIIGRAGRRGQNSRCLIQSFSPDHPLFEMLGEEKSFERFAEQELGIRQAAELPPYSRMLMWTLSDKSESKVSQAAQSLSHRLSKLSKALGVELMGPMEAPLYRWKSEFRQQLLAKAASQAALSQFMSLALNDIEERPLGVKLKTDRDPYQFL